MKPLRFYEVLLDNQGILDSHPQTVHYLSFIQPASHLCICLINRLLSTYWGFPGGSDGKGASNLEDLGSILRLARSPGGGHENPVKLEKTLESPLDSKEIRPVHPKGYQS